MKIAIGISLLVHAALLGVRFVAPSALGFTPLDPGLEVILVNAKHDRQPFKADALAQANLDGGGNAEAGRAKSPLPDLRRIEDNESVRAAMRKVSDLEEIQQKLLAQVNSDGTVFVPPLTDKNKPEVAPLQPKGSDSVDSTKAIARMTAEITQTIDDQNKRPRKTFISPSTREVGYAGYYKNLQKRIEEIGTLNFPQHNGKKLYGEMILYIPISQDGSIYLKEGGIRIERSSGNPVLDNAALAIVRRSAPFGRFPPNMLSSDKDDLWIIITRFKFTREEKMETELRGGE